MHVDTPSGSKMVYFQLKQTVEGNDQHKLATAMKDAILGIIVCFQCRVQKQRG